jgi:hypothetical protein
MMISQSLVSHLPRLSIRCPLSELGHKLGRPLPTHLLPELLYTLRLQSDEVSEGSDIGTQTDNQRPLLPPQKEHPYSADVATDGADSGAIVSCCTNHLQSLLFYDTNLNRHREFTPVLAPSLTEAAPYQQPRRPSIQNSFPRWASIIGLAICRCRY